MPDTWQINRCATCKSVYLNPRPDVSSLPAAYADYLTHTPITDERVLTSSSPSWGLVRGYLRWRFGLHTSLPTFSAGRWLFSAIEPWRLKLDRFGRHLTRQRFPQPGRLLDVGCGNGTFLKLAQAMGWTAFGCDPDPDVIAICQETGLNATVGDIDVFASEHASFDAITLNQVIEHVPDPLELLRQCKDLLKPGGVIWLGFPSPAALGLNVFGQAWANLHPPYHFCLPAQHIIRGWLMKAGFAEIQFMRRGAHASADWAKSNRLEKVFGTHSTPLMRGRSGQIVTDLLGSITSRWGEETAVIAINGS